MKYLALFLLILFPLGQLIRLSVPGTEIVIHPNDLAVAGLVIVWLIRRKDQLFRFAKLPLVRPLALFALAVLVSLLANLFRFSPQELLTAALYPLRFFAYAGLYFVFRDTFLENPKPFLRWLLIAILIITGFGLAQYVFVPNVAFLSALDWDDHYYRLVGNFLDPGFTGAILALGLLQAYFRRHRWLLVPPIYAALALTYSRASYLMYLVIFASVAFYKRSWRIIFVALTVLILTVFLLPKSNGEGTKLNRENSILARINNWKESVTVWGQNPVFGVGFNTYRYMVNVPSQSHSGGADSSIFLVLATTGIVGEAAFIYLLWKMWQAGSFISKASLLGILVHSFFNNTLFYPWVMEWLWITLAISAQGARYREQSG